MEQIEYMLKIAFNVERTKNTDFIKYAKNGNLDIIKLFFNYNIKIDDATMNQSLNMAAKKGHLEMVKLLIEKDACISKTTLWYGAKNGHLEIVKYLIENEEIDMEDAFVEAIENGHLDVVSFLIEKGVDIYADDNSALLAGVIGERLEIIKLLISKGASAKKTLKLAIIWDKIKVVKFLIEENISSISSKIIIHNLYDNEITDYLLSKCNDSILREIFNEKDNMFPLLEYIVEKDLLHYHLLINIAREYGYDIYDMIEKEQL